MISEKKESVRRAVRQHYGEIAEVAGTTCCSPSPDTTESTFASGCCGGPGTERTDEIALKIGYSPEDIAAVPDGSNLGLGCGNPIAIASLKAGEAVLDLGSGAGFDCFLAAQRVGPTGKVIGIDMTPEMIAKARVNAEKNGFTNVEFRLGEIEHLPVADNSIDVIISNCVINLSAEKRLVLNEAFRVLKPGGRISISDIVATRPVPESLRDDLTLISCCIGGAETLDRLREMLSESGFVDVRIDLKKESKGFIKDWFPGTSAEEYVSSSIIEAAKP